MNDGQTLKLLILKFLLLGGLLALGGSTCLGADGAAMGTNIIFSPANSVWKYLDTGVPPGVSWRNIDFDDSAWLSGPGPLGYDMETIPATLLSYGTDEENKPITAWFRRAFVVTNAAYCQRLLLRVLRDDGVVVYLNGIEVARDNMPAGEITADTPAVDIVEEGWVYHTFDFAIPLREGTNVLAAEVHQWDSASTDLLFDLELTCPINRGPYLQPAGPGSMLVRWRTPQPMESLVHFGTNLSNLRQRIGDATLTNDHYLLLTNLAPDTRYFYRVERNDLILASGTGFCFHTPPLQSRSTRIWAIGDCGTSIWGPAWEVMVKSVRDAYYQFAGNRDTDVWLMLGDNAYYQGTEREYQLGIFNVYQRMLSCTPVWSTIGNHEVGGVAPDGHLHYFDVFSPPTRGESGGVASGTKNYYSFNRNNIHFVCLDSMLSDRSTNGVMWSWLQQDLAENTNDWLIAFWHHPPYSHGNHDSDNRIGEDPELVEMRQTFLPILEAYGVDLVLCGHSHTYERSFLLDGHYGYSPSLQPGMLKDAGSGRPEDTGAYRKAGTGPAPNQGAVYVVAGSAGSTTGGPLDHPVMCVSLNQLGSMVIDVEGNRLDARFLRETGAIDDSFTILKGVAPAPLRLVGLSLGNGGVVLKWKSEAGHAYTVEKTVDLANPAWVAVSGPITASGATTFWSGQLDPTAGQAFYRVVSTTHGFEWK